MEEQHTGYERSLFFPAHLLHQLYHTSLRYIFSNCFQTSPRGRSPNCVSLHWTIYYTSTEDALWHVRCFVPTRLKSKAWEAQLGLLHFVGGVWLSQSCLDNPLFQSSNNIAGHASSSLCLSTDYMHDAIFI